MTLYLIRHGETALNAARVLQPAGTPLSALGQRQADALARRLAGVGLAGILSSDLTRTLDTAAPLVAATTLPLLTSPLLQERNFGDLRGLPYDTLDHDPIHSPNAPPGGESMETFQARCIAAWGEVRAIQARLNGPLAVVTHGLVLRCWLTLGPLVLADGLQAPASLGNTSLTIASAAAPHLVSLVNCQAHLAPGQAEQVRSLSGG
jgi:broad specificity phosphatase PhoE